MHCTKEEGADEAAEVPRRTREGKRARQQRTRRERVDECREGADLTLEEHIPAM